MKEIKITAKKSSKNAAKPNNNSKKPTSKVVKFWTCIQRDGYDDWQLVDGIDESSVPVAAWKTLNKEFWERRQREAYFPLDDMDAYQIACREMIRACERVRSADGGFRLRRSTLVTYLVAAAFNTLNKYQERVIDRGRAQQRALMEATCDATGKPMETREYAENLPDENSLAFAAARRAARRDAKLLVRMTLAKLDADAQAGLTAFMAANGVFVDAARLYDPEGSVQGYTYRFHHIWAPAFRRACLEAR